MSAICILDTGFLKTTNSGTQLSATNRANSGSLIELHAVDFKPSFKSNLDTTPTLGTFSEAEVNLVSIENINFQITGKLDKNNSSDMDLAYQLGRLVRTRGYKAVFYNVDRTATDSGNNSTQGRDKQLVTRIANSHVDVEEPQGDISFSLWTGQASEGSKDLTDVDHLMVRFNSLTFGQTADTAIITFTLNGVTTA